MTKAEKLEIINRMNELVEQICDGIYTLSEILCTAFDAPDFETGISDAVSVEYPFHKSLEEIDTDCIVWAHSVWEELSKLTEEPQRKDA